MATLFIDFPIVFVLVAALVAFSKLATFIDSAVHVRLAFQIP